MRRASARVRVGALCLVLGVGGLSLVAWSANGQPRPRTTGSPDAAPATRPADPSPSPDVVVEARPAQRTGAVRPEQPRAVRLPNGVRVPVRAVSSRSDGRLDVPHDIRTAGWWRGGARLGDPWGATLLAAHVDSRTQGLGPYAALLGVRRGQEFVLDSATLRQRFEVTSLRLIPQGNLTHRPWISSSSGARRLVLVTCAPPYKPARGGYQNLAVVTATPTSGPIPRASR